MGNFLNRQASTQNWHTGLPKVKTNRLPDSTWPAYFLILPLPLWWALGMDMFIWPLLVLPLVYLMIRDHRHIVVPRGFFIWFLFLIWLLLSATTLTDVSTVKQVSFVWRASLYLAASVVFVYFYNASSPRLTRSIVWSATAYWTFVSIGGYAGVVFPLATYQSPMAEFVPAGLTNNAFIQDAVIIRRLAGLTWFDVPRPSAGFPYTNRWGSAFTLLVPMVAAGYALSSALWKKGILTVLLGLGAVPLTFSLNRGAWLTLGIGLLYAGLLGMWRKQPALAWSAMVPALMIGGMVAFTPLKDLAVDNMKHKASSNATRMSLYKGSVHGALESPLIGKGTPGAGQEGNPTSSDAPNPAKHGNWTQKRRPSTGTHGQVWLVLYSQGFPGLFLFLGWLAYLLLKSARTRSLSGTWCHVVVAMGTMQSFFYELTGTGLMIVFMAAAIAIRDEAGSADPIRSNPA